MFKIGDRVTWKKNPPPRKINHAVQISSIIKSGEVREVKGTMFCTHCGKQFLDFDHLVPPEFSNSNCIECCDCGNATPYAYPRIWYRALDFEKVVYNNVSEEIANKITEVKETSDQPILNPNPQPERVKVNI